MERPDSNVDIKGLTSVGGASVGTASQRLATERSERSERSERHALYFVHGHTPVAAEAWASINAPSATVKTTDYAYCGDIAFHPETIPLQPKDWSVEIVYVFMRHFVGQTYADAFRREGVDGFRFMTLTEAELSKCRAAICSSVKNPLWLPPTRLQSFLLVRKQLVSQLEDPNFNVGFGVGRGGHNGEGANGESGVVTANDHGANNEAVAVDPLGDSKERVGEVLRDNNYIDIENNDVVHVATHEMVEIAINGDECHENGEGLCYCCDGCDKEGLTRVRFHCMSCEDFDLCSACRFVETQGEALALPKTGITLTGLQSFVERCGGRDKLQGMTTGDVCEKFVKPFTIECQTSYCDWVASGASDMPASHVGPADVFVSHAWRYTFLDVLDTLVKKFSTNAAVAATETGTDTDTGTGQNSDKELVLWFDVFSNDQHHTLSLPFEWWTTTFQSAIAQFGHTVMVLLPWDNPIPLTRSWCLWEIYSTVVTNTKLDIAMPEKQHEEFVQSLMQDFSTINSMLARVDVGHSEAWKREDQERIMEAVRDTVGVEAVNKVVFNRLRQWLVETASAQLDRLRLQMQSAEHTTIDSEGNTLDVSGTDGNGLGSVRAQMYHLMTNLGALLHDVGDRNASLLLLQEACSGKKEHYGLQDPSTMLAMNNVAASLDAAGRPEEALALYQEVFSALREHGRDKDPNTLSCMSNVAMSLATLGRHQESVEMMLSVVSLSKDTLGATHKDTLLSMNNLAGALLQHGRFSEAEVLFNDVSQGYSVTVGESHPFTLGAFANLAACMKMQGPDRFEDVEVLYRKVLSGRRERFGDTHADTLTSINNLAMMLKAQRRVDEAAVLYAEAVDGLRATMGPLHAQTIGCLNNLAMLMFSSGKLREAEPLLRQVHDSTSQKFGQGHPQTLLALSNLAGLVSQLGRHDEALPMLRQVHGGMHNALGPSHAETIGALTGLGIMLVHLEMYDEAISCYGSGLQRLSQAGAQPHDLAIVALKTRLDDAMARQTAAVDAQDEPIEGATSTE